MSIFLVIEPYVNVEKKPLPNVRTSSLFVPLLRCWLQLKTREVILCVVNVKRSTLDWLCLRCHWVFISVVLCANISSHTIWVCEEMLSTIIADRPGPELPDSHWGSVLPSFFNPTFPPAKSFHFWVKEDQEFLSFFSNITKNSCSYFLFLQ